MSDDVWAIVPAAGIGTRMQSSRPKQYLALEDKTVIEHTLAQLASHPRIIGIVVAIANNDSWWSELTFDFSCLLYVAEGGKHRADSVLSAIKTLATKVDNDPWLLVHDAARPCLRHEDIDAMLDSLCEHQVGGVLGMPITDTVKRCDDMNTILHTVERANLWRAVTPQMFRLQTLKKALQEAKKQGITVTDEAGAVERCGLSAIMVEGHADNIKITLPQDLALAAMYLRQQKEGL